MSTPFSKPPQGDPALSYVPKWAREEVVPAVSPPVEQLDSQSLPGAAVDHDERVFREVEYLLGEMVSAKHDVKPPQPVSLSDVSRIAAEQLADKQAAALKQASEVKPVTSAKPDLVIEGVRVPSSLVPRSLEPDPVPWPRPRPRAKGSNPTTALFIRFGLAATGAAAVATFVVQGVPSLLYDKLTAPMSELSSGLSPDAKASYASARLAESTKQQERAPTAPATANAGPPPPLELLRNQFAVAKADSLTTAHAEPRKEIVATPPWPGTRQEAAIPPWPATGSEPATWPGPAGRAPIRESATSGSAARSVTAEDIAMLRKQGEQYIAAGDFVGARIVLERAADAGDASAALALAATYDPVVLTQSKVRGLTPDIAKAGLWYQKAHELGSREASRRLQALGRENWANHRD